jgi:hypothetical protein
MTTTTKPAPDRPLPRSYLPEEKKAGMTQNAIYFCESRAADRAGDDEASWAWLALANIPEFAKLALIDCCGEEFVKAKGFNI